MASKQPSTTTQIQKVELPKWVEAASEDNYKLAQKLANQPFKQYQGDRVAGMGQMAKDGLKYFSDNMGSSQAGYGGAMDIFEEMLANAQGLQGSRVNAQNVGSGSVFADMTKAGNTNAMMTQAGNTTAGTTTADRTTAGSVQAGKTTARDAKSREVQAQMLRDMDLDPYLNPYIENVENKSLEALDRSRQMSILQNQGSAGASGAFGGSRHGITDAVTNSESAREAGLLSANLRREGYDNATGLATADINRKLSTDIGNADRATAVSVGNADRTLNSDQGNMNRILQALMSNRDATLTSDMNNANRSLTSGMANMDRILGSDTNNMNRQLHNIMSNADRRLQSDTNNANRQLTNSMGNRDAKLSALTGNRNAALQAATGNADRNLQAGGMNMQNILDTFMAKSGAMNTAAGGMASVAGASQEAKMKDFMGMLQGGQLQQGNKQMQLDSQREKFGEGRQNDIDNLNLLLSSLGMSPYGKTETTQKTSMGGQNGTDFGQMGMGIFSMLLGLSEDDTKTDKEKVGKLPGTDLDMWAFRYKKDPKNYPKVVGVMASDVEKKMPEAVHRVGGKRVINYGMIGEAMQANG